MKALLFIFLFLFVQEPVKKDTVKKEVERVDMDKVIEQLKIQNQKADSVIATKQAEKMYNLSDTIK